MTTKPALVPPRRVLLVCGSLRARSTNAAVLRTVQAVAPPHIVCSLFEGMAGLAPFNPDLEERLAASVAALRSEIHSCDAILISTSEYAGALT